MASPRESAVRRFATVWTLSTLVKIAALAVFLALALSWVGGIRP